jgi:hypothetical protein
MKARPFNLLQSQNTSKSRANYQANTRAIGAFGRLSCGAVAAALLAALLVPAVLFAATALGLAPFSSAPTDALPAPWRVVGFPTGNKPITKFDITRLDADKVLRIASDKSYGWALHELPPQPLAPHTVLSWRWRLDQPLLLANLKQREGDDVALKICALFEMPLDKLSLLDAAALRMSRSMSAEKVPAATLCYVWDHLLPAGTEMPNIFSKRLRFVVMESGERQLRQWIPHERDLQADFARAFGHETDTPPMLIGIAVGADSDNTQGVSLGYVGDVVLGR